jgi:hypothetical protein
MEASCHNHRSRSTICEARQHCRAFAHHPPDQQGPLEMPTDFQISLIFWRILASNLPTLLHTFSFCSTSSHCCVLGLTSLGFAISVLGVGNTGLSTLWKVLEWELTIHRHSICQQRHPNRSINTAVYSSVSIIKSFNPSSHFNTGSAHTIPSLKCPPALLVDSSELWS